jgi:hypothetical protein
MSNNVGIGTIEKFDPENMVVTAGILFLSALELVFFIPHSRKFHDRFITSRPSPKLVSLLLFSVISDD